MGGAVPPHYTTKAKRNKMTPELQFHPQKERKKIVLHCGESRTIQDTSDLTDINQIVAKGRKTGSLVDPSKIGTRIAIFGDFSSGQDFEETQLRIASVNEEFATLPAKLREEFSNSPQVLLEAMQDPDEEVIAFLSENGLKSIHTIKAAEGIPVSGQETPPADDQAVDEPGE